MGINSITIIKYCYFYVYKLKYFYTNTSSKAFSMALVFKRTIESPHLLFAIREDKNNFKRLRVKYVCWWRLAENSHLFRRPLKCITRKNSEITHVPCWKCNKLTKSWTHYLCVQATLRTSLRNNYIKFKYC